MSVVVVANPQFQIVSGSSDPVSTKISGSSVLIQTEDSAVKNITVNEGVSGSSPGIYIHGKSIDGKAIVPNIIQDDVSDYQSLYVTGKVSLVSPMPPVGKTQITIDNSSPLSIASTSNVKYTIASGSTFVLQQIIAGSEGDTSERGSVVEVYYSGSDLSSHIVSRVYVSGFTTFIQPNTSQARDGTSLGGDGTAYLVLRRRRLSGAAQEVDCVVRGYEI